MDERFPIDVPCPGCDGADTVLHYQPIYEAGAEDPVDHVKKGAKCESCGLSFWIPELDDIDPMGESGSEGGDNDG